MTQSETQPVVLGKYHVLRFDKGHYSYECERGLAAGGPWDNRPKRCNGIGCGRELVEQSTLDAAIESAATQMRTACVEKVKTRLAEVVAKAEYAHYTELSDLNPRRAALEEVKADLESPAFVAFAERAGVKLTVDAERISDLIDQLVAITGPCDCDIPLCDHWKSEAGIILTAALDQVKQKGDQI